MKFWNDKGNIAVMAALTMPMVIGGAGLGVETGYWYYQQLSLQQAADAAAYAAALEHHEGNEGEMETSAQAAAELNGFDAAADGLAMAWPATAYPSDERSVDIELTRAVPRAFSALFGTDPINITVRSTARYDPSVNACLLALSNSGTGVAISGNASMSITGCVVSANSIAANSITSQGASSATMPCMTTAGEVVLTSAVHFTSCDAAMTNLPPAADPYQDLLLPTPGSCKPWPAGTAVHTPGTYCGNLPGIHNRVHVFGAGTYIFDNADLAVNGSMGGGMSCPDGCTFVFMNGSNITMNGNPTISVVAPTTGTYAGMLFVGDQSAETHIFNGSAASNMTGTIYMPGGAVQYNGNFSGFNGCTQVVANTIAWSGSTTINVDCSTYGMSSIEIGGRPYLVG
jgi:hypothetical protein